MEHGLESIKKYVRAANYLTAVQIYLQDNFLLGRKLSFDDIKPRLLGHWGTCPGINLVYANLNYLIKKYNARMLFILGPGHGFPALQANLFIEGTLGKYYPDVTQNANGIGYMAKNFSWPYGFPSHSNPGSPGVILEGGELGYALSTAYGAVLDNPDLIAACVIGDGEAETGPTATAWHLNKFIDPATNGAVLPILHLNGYKISGPTIFGRMSNRELKALFIGYGYEPHIVDGKNLYEKTLQVMEDCYRSIREIQDRARKGASSELPPRFPMIILKTPKGWTGIKKLNGKKIEGNYLSHQVIASGAKTNKDELKAIDKWFRSYNFNELFNADSGFIDGVRELIPAPELLMGRNKHTFGGEEAMKPLILPTASEFSEDASVPGTMGSSSMRRAGLYLNKVFQLNKENKNFRLMSPDETYSNKLDAVFETTARAFMLPKEKWDKDLEPSGRVMEMLSEHSLQGMMQGYVLTGRHAIFASYEAFIQIISSMVDQYSKFIKIAREFPWRGDVPSLNYILTSSGWRQEHNGFSHQNPGFISNILHKHGCLVHVYFPPDGNSTLAVLKKCLSLRNAINVIVAGKTQEPRWLTPELAEKEMGNGLMTWDFASDPDPDIVISAVGDYLSKEALAAIDIIKQEASEIKVRFVNIMELSVLEIGNSECVVPWSFDSYFTHDKPVIFNFHGYPGTLKQILFDKENDNRRFSVHGYIENGSTTTPFDMQVRNETSRYHLAKEVFAKMAKAGVVSQDKSDQLIKKYDKKLEEHREFIKKYGVDPEEIENWQWTRNI
ncbi:MAG: phosphoketolase family protein [Candidatus Harrisonbacteria bacterium]|nr:phosphoketolase family protein [Candidatus Harrisonbacteria bacterium]